MGWGVRVVLALMFTGFTWVGFGHTLEGELREGEQESFEDCDCCVPLEGSKEDEELLEMIEKDQEFSESEDLVKHQDQVGD